MYYPSRIVRVAVILLSLAYGEVFGQVCSIPSIVGADSICRGDTARFTLSTSTNDVVWDVCGNDLFTPAATLSTFTIPNAAQVGGIRFVKQGDSLLAFITNRASGEIIRLVYPQGIQSNPVIQNLGNFGGAFEGPESFDVEINSAGEKSLVVSNILPLLGSNADTTTLTRLSFGNSFMNTPVLSQLPVWKQSVFLPRGLKILEVGDTLFYVQGDFNRNRVEVAWRLKTDSTFVETVSFQVSNQHLCLDIIDCGNHEFYLMLGAQLTPPVLLKFKGSLNALPSIIPMSNPIFNDRFSSVKWLSFQDSLYVLAGQIDRSVALYRVEILNDSVRFISQNRYTALTVGPQPNAADFIFEREGWAGLMATFNPATFVAFQWKDTCSASIVQNNGDTAAILFSDSGRFSIAAQINPKIFAQRRIRVLSTPVPEFLTVANCLNDTLRAFAIDTSSTYIHQWLVNGVLNSNTNFINRFLQDTSSLIINHIVSNQCGSDSVFRNVQIRPGPDITIVAPDSVCAFSNQTLTSINSVPNGIDRVVWEIGGIQIFGDTVQFSFPTIGNNPVRIFLVDTLGCSTTDSTVINVQDAPQVSFSVLAACIGDSIRLQNTSQGIGALTANWNIADSTWTGQTYDFSFFPSDTGQIPVVLAVANTTGCENVLLQNIRVFSLPEALFSAGVNCEGQLIDVQDSSFSADDFITLREWSISNPVINFIDSSVNTLPVWILPDTGFFQVNLLVSTQNGCSDSLQSGIYAWQRPEMIFSSVPACLGDTSFFVNLSSTVQPGNTLTQYLWNFGDPSLPGNTSNNFAPFRIYSNAGKYVVTLSGFTMKGCFGQFSDTVVVHPKPNTSFVPVKTCQNEPLEFQTFSLLGSDSLLNWRWFEPITAQSDSLIQPGFLFNLNGNYSIRLIGSSIFGCTDSTDVAFTVFPSPIAAFIPSDTLAVIPAEIQFTNVSTGNVQSIWTFEPGSIDSSNAQTVSYLYTSEGIFRPLLEVLSLQNCRDVDSISLRIVPPVIDAEIVAISALPSAGKLTPSIQIKNTSNVAIQNVELSFAINAEPGFSKMYEIQIPIDQIRTVQAQEVLYNTKDQLCVRIAAINKASPVTLSRTCILEEGGVKILGVYESGDFISPRIFCSNRIFTEIRVIDSKGKLLYNSALELFPGIRYYPLREILPASGIYFLHLSSPLGDDLFKFSRIH